MSTYKKLKVAPARTPLERLLKKAVLGLLENQEDIVIDPVEIKIPVSENNADVLRQFARENKIHIPDPCNKPEHIEAIEAWLERNS